MKKILMTLIALMMALSLSGCGSENKYVRIGLKENVDGMNLYLTGKATGLQGVSNYVYIDGSDDYVNNVINKMGKSYAGIDVAYFEVEDLKTVFNSDIADQLHIVYIDSYNEDGTIKAVWVARESYMENCPKYFPKFIKGLAASADYRAKNCQLSGSYEELKETVKQAGSNEGSWAYQLVDFTDYNFDDFTNIYQYCAIYSLQNEVNDNFDITSACFKDNEFAYSTYCEGDLTNNELLKELYAKCDTSISFDEIFKLDAMNDGVIAVKNTVASEDEGNPLQAILWGGGLFVLVAVIVIVIVSKSKKEGKKLFDIKAALDADIESDLE